MAPGKGLKFLFSLCWYIFYKTIKSGYKTNLFENKRISVIYTTFCIVVYDLLMMLASLSWYFLLEKKANLQGEHYCGSLISYQCAYRFNYIKMLLTVRESVGSFLLIPEVIKIVQKIRSASRTRPAWIFLRIDYKHSNTLWKRKL